MYQNTKTDWTYSQKTTLSLSVMQGSVMKKKICVRTSNFGQRVWEQPTVIKVFSK